MFRQQLSVVLHELCMDTDAFEAHHFPQVLHRYDQLSMSAKRNMFSALKIPNGFNKFHFELVRQVQNYLMSQIDQEELKRTAKKVMVDLVLGTRPTRSSIAPLWMQVVEMVVKNHPAICSDKIAALVQKSTKQIADVHAELAGIWRYGEQTSWNGQPRPCPYEFVDKYTGTIFKLKQMKLSANIVHEEKPVMKMDDLFGDVHEVQQSFTCSAKTDSPSYFQEQDMFDLIPCDFDSILDE